MHYLRRTARLEGGFSLNFRRKSCFSYSVMQHFHFSSSELKLCRKIYFTWKKKGRIVEEAKERSGLTKYKITIPIILA